MPAPALFDPALRAARRRRCRPEGAFLARETARSAAERLGFVNRTFPRAALVGDPAAVWAEELTSHPAIGRLDRVEEGETLAFPDPPYDLVLHAPWLHAANDPVGALVQSRLALAPDGLLLGALWGGETLADLRDALAEAEVAETGGLSPRVHPMASVPDLGALLQRAGLAMPVADVERLAVTWPDLPALCRDLRAMGETNVLADRLRRFTRRTVFARAAALLATRAGTPDGRIATAFEAVFLTGWAPGPGQPRPKRPGSATARLADALGAVERSAGEKAGG